MVRNKSSKKNNSIENETLKPAAPALRIFVNIVLISLGSLICAVAVNGILLPRGFLSSGMTGVSILIHYLFPALPVGMIYFVLNIPLFALSWLYVGRRFFLYSILGLVIFTLMLSVIKITINVSDPLLSALLAGIIFGTGTGLILRSDGSSGGTDILSIILLKRFSIRLGSTLLAFNSILLATAGLVFNLEAALYALIFLYVSSQIMNLVVTGFSQRKSVFIISTAGKNSDTRVVVSCEHAGNRIPSSCRDIINPDEKILETHRAYDIGALDLARCLAQHCGAQLYYSTVTRLLADLNRRPRSPALSSEFVRRLDAGRKKEILGRYYHPYRNAVRKRMETAIRSCGSVLHLSIHTFTPVFDGQVRNVDIGILYDPERVLEKQFARQLRAVIADLLPAMRCRFNYPYRGTADGLATCLRKCFPQEHYRGIEIEINQNLVSCDTAEREKRIRLISNAIISCISGGLRQLT